MKICLLGKDIIYLGFSVTYLQSRQHEGTLVRKGHVKQCYVKKSLYSLKRGSLNVIYLKYKTFTMTFNETRFNDGGNKHILTISASRSFPDLSKCILK